MTWRKLLGAENLWVQLYGCVVGEGFGREFLLVGKGETFGPESDSRLFVRTSNTGDFIPAGQVISAFKRTYDSGRVYEYSRLTLQDKLGPHYVMRTRFRGVDGANWQYDELPVTPIAMSGTAHFKMVDEELITLERGHSHRKIHPS